MYMALQNSRSYPLHFMQVYWLLLAISQDQLKNTYVAELRDQCERAALEGYWVHPLPWSLAHVQAFIAFAIRESIVSNISNL